MPVHTDTEVNFWKLKAADFLIETGKFVKNTDVTLYRNETIDRLNKIAGSDAIHLIIKTDDITETIVYSSDPANISLFTDTSFLKPAETSDSIIFHESLQIPMRSHFLKAYKSAVIVSIDEVFFNGALILTWKEKYSLPDGYSIFMNIVMGRIKGIMRLTSTKFAAEDLAAKFDAVFHTVSQGLIFMDDSGNEALVNTRGKHMLDIQQAGEKFPPVLISESMKRLISRSENKDEINATAQTLFREAEKRIDDWIWKFTDQVFSVSSAPFISTRVKGRLWVFEDITNLFFANDKLRQANHDIKIKNERLEALNTEKNDLIGIVSHDLRSPLAQVKILSGFLSMDDNPLSEEQKSTVAMLEQVSDKGIKLIKDLLDISAIEQQQINKKIEKLNLSESITTAMHGFKAVAEKKNISVNVDSNVSQAMVMADQDYLTRILDNLVSNAIKFSHPNTSVTISVDKKDNNKFLLAVKDEGQGIREDEMKKLFGKFSRLSARPTAKESSTGLGLYIVKSLVEELGGRIWCESVWEHGTTFFVELPVAPK